MADLPVPYSQEERLACAAAHLAFMAHSFLPLAALVIPIAILMYFQGKSDFAVAHAKEALNFQLTLVAATLVCVLLAFAFVGFLLLPVLLLASIALPIVAALKAWGGESYRYPLSIRFVS